MDPQTCQSLSSLDDTMFTTMGKIFSHCYVLTGMFPIFIARASLQSVLLTSSVNDSLLISSILRYVDEFEQDALNKSVMNGDINADIDEEVYNNVVAILSRCLSAQLPTRKNICQLVCSVAMSELVCRPTHALQAIHKGLLTAYPWRCITVEDISHLYSDLIPTPKRVWQLISPVNEIMTRQEEKVFDFLRFFVLSLNFRMLGLFLRFRICIWQFLCWCQHQSEL